MTDGFKCPACFGSCTRLPSVQPVYSAPPLAVLLTDTAQAVAAVRTGRSLSDWLPRVEPQRRPGVQALTFQVMRRMGGAQAVRQILAPRAPAPEVDALVLSALALLWPQEGPAPYPDHTLVDQAVAAARRIRPAAAGFVNAVLRRFLREREAFVAQAAQEPEGRWNHPGWWARRLQADWPQAWQALLEAADRRAPMTLRVNARRLSGQAWLERLRAAGGEGRLLEGPLLGGQAVVLAEPRPVEQLPGFAEGEVSVQDAHAQLAAPLLARALRELANGLPGRPPRVLDACAAPGGKTAHLLELIDARLVAMDLDPRRLERVTQTLQRLGLQAEVRAADAAEPARWWDGEPFDAILLDAPCTASGIVRRHPDIRWLRRPADVGSLAAQQARLLDALWPLLRPGGVLLYATCSLFQAEGAQQIDAFLQRQRLPAEVLDPASPGHLLPLADNSGKTQGAGSAGPPGDGFHYALMHKP